MFHVSFTVEDIALVFCLCGRTALSHRSFWTHQSCAHFLRHTIFPAPLLYWAAQCQLCQKRYYYPWMQRPSASSPEERKCLTLSCISTVSRSDLPLPRNSLSHPRNCAKAASAEVSLPSPLVSKIGPQRPAVAFRRPTPYLCHRTVTKRPTLPDCTLNTAHRATLCPSHPCAGFQARLTAGPVCRQER